MSKLIISLIIKRLDKYANMSAFIHWVVLGVIIAYIQIPFSPWLKGIIIAEISVLPIIIIVLKNEPKSVIPVFAMSAILGAFVGITTAKFAI